MTEVSPANPLLDAARTWYDAGYCVVPSHEDGGKRPFGRWKEFQTTRPTWEQLHAWLATNKYTGIGVITGAASGNAEMIELEGPSDHAVANLGALKVAAIKLGCHELFQTIAVGCSEASAGGGLHMFYFVNNGQAVKNTKLAASIDNSVIAETRGEGGFVIVAPTPARKGHADGSAYLLLGNATPAHTPHISTQQRDVLHQLFTIALHQQQPEPTPTTTSSTPVIHTGLTPWDDYATNTTWADILTPHGWQYLYTAPDGRTHWVRPGKPINEGTSATTLEDGPFYVFSTSTTFPAMQGMSKQYVYAHLHHEGDMRQAARALNDQGFGDSHTSNALTTWDYQPPTLNDTDISHMIRERFPVLNWHELWADETEEHWIVEPLLAERRLVALYSAPKVGKSLLMLEIAAAIASGTAMFGYPPKDPRRVLYVDFENDPRGDVRTRLQDMGYQPDQLDNLLYLSFPTMNALDSEQGSQELMAAVSEYDCTVVVIDTVSRAIKGDENENDTWLNFYRHTGLKLKQAGIAMIRLDHSGKDEKKGQRGGSAKSGDVDAIWQLKVSTGDIVDLICDAARFPVPTKTLTLKRLTNPLRHKATNDGYLDKINDLITQMETHGIPRHTHLSVKEFRALIRSKGIRFDSDYVNTAFIERYAQRITPIEIQHP